MQTITEKEVNAGLTQASDAAFINAFTADGTPIKISKADLASVVAGLLPFFGPTRFLTGSDSLNSLSGNLVVCTNGLSQPTEYNENEYNHTTLQIENSSRHDKLQIDFCSNDRNIKTRFKRPENPTWSQWQKLLQF